MQRDQVYGTQLAANRDPGTRQGGRNTKRWPKLGDVKADRDARDRSMWRITAESSTNASVLLNLFYCIRTDGAREIVSYVSASQEGLLNFRMYPLTHLPSDWRNRGRVTTTVHVKPAERTDTYADSAGWDRQHDRAKGVDILMKDLKVFASFNEELFKEITHLLTLENFSGARAPPPTNGPLVGTIPKSGAFPPIGAHSVIGCRFTTLSSIAAFLKHPRTPTSAPGLDYQTADSEHLMKRMRMGQSDEVWKRKI
ncbi:hypothetical protein GW17_00047640 [Ensete ventricosum]|nr:hypothetical protein GW17_00047640 [Ensete ventricosum]